MSNTYFYERISTEEERGKQKFDRQDNALMKYAEDNGLDFDEHYIYRDDKSGKNFTARTEWKKLEKNLKANDTIVFKDICRFTRECQNGLKKYMELLDKNVNLVFLDNPTISTDYIKALGNVKDNSDDNILNLTLDFIVKLILTVELDRAEKERLITSQRIKDGIKASDKQSGRKKGKIDKITDELKADLELYSKDRSIKVIDLLNKHNISRNTFKKYLALYKSGQLE